MRGTGGDGGKHAVEFHMVDLHMVFVKPQHSAEFAGDVHIPADNVAFAVKVLERLEFGVGRNDQSAVIFDLVGTHGGHVDAGGETCRKADNREYDCESYDNFLFHLYTPCSENIFPLQGEIISQCARLRN